MKNLCSVKQEVKSKKLKRIEITQSLFSDHNGFKLEINNKDTCKISKYEQSLNTHGSNKRISRKIYNIRNEKGDININPTDNKE